MAKGEKRLANAGFSRAFHARGKNGGGKNPAETGRIEDDSGILRAAGMQHVGADQSRGEEVCG